MTVAPLEIAYNFLHDEPRSAARLLETRERQAVVRFLEQAPVQDAAATLLEMHAQVAGPVLTQLNGTRMADIASLLSNHELSTMVRSVAQEERQHVLAALPEWRRLSCKTLLRFDEDMVGMLTQTDVPVFAGDLPVEECLLRMKRQPFKRSALVYVVDREKKLLGAVPLAGLMYESHGRPLETLPLEFVPHISGRTSLTAALHHSGWQHSDTLAIVSSRSAFIGTVEHHTLRKALSAPLATAPGQHPVNELLSAFTASMTGLLELFEVDLSAATQR